MNPGARALEAPSPPSVMDYFAMTKPRLTFAVLITAAAGFIIGSPGTVDFIALTHLVVGTALAAIGASILNMHAERDIDAIMSRTANRPIPSGRFVPGRAYRAGWAIGTAGILYLSIIVNAMTAVLTAVCLGVYIFVYTPEKTRSPLSTVVGAVSGALPPVIGWAAARGSVGLMAAYLFGLMFFWQIPHFLAIAWIYQEDYRAAGIKVLPVTDPTGSSTSAMVLMTSLLLFWMGLYPAAFGYSGNLYYVSAIIAGSIFLASAFAFAARRSLVSARFLFFTSLVYVMAVFGVMAWERLSL